MVSTFMEYIYSLLGHFETYLSTTYASAGAFAIHLMSFHDGVFSFNEPNDQRSVKVDRKPESNQVASGVFYNWPGDWRPVLSE